MNEEEAFDEEFYEEYGEEMTDAFFNFFIHLKQYAMEMNLEVHDKAMDFANSFATNMDIEVSIEEEDGEKFFAYKRKNESMDDETFFYLVLKVHLKFSEKLKELDPVLWKKAVEYSADYGGSGRVNFYFTEDEDKKNDDGNNEDSGS